MPYETIKPPFTLNFPEMSRGELKMYFRWFVDVLPCRIQALSGAVMDTPAYEVWMPDNTPESLELLGTWLAGQVEARPRTMQERQAIEARSIYPVEIAHEELTNRTFSLAVDIG